MKQVLKLRKRRTGQWALVAGLSLLLANQGQEVAAAEQVPVWVARTVEEVKKDLTTSADSQRYLIKWGDTLSVIAQALDIDVSVLAQINDIANADLIYAGNTLYISKDGTRLVVADGRVAQTYVVQEVVSPESFQTEIVVAPMEEIPLADTEKIEEFLEGNQQDGQNNQSIPTSPQGSQDGTVTPPPPQLGQDGMVPPPAPQSGQDGQFTPASPQGNQDGQVTPTPPQEEQEPPRKPDTSDPQSPDTPLPLTQPDDKLLDEPELEVQPDIIIEVISREVVEKEEVHQLEPTTDQSEVTETALSETQDGEQIIRTVERLEITHPDILYIKDFSLPQGFVTVEDEGTNHQVTFVERLIYDQNDYLTSREQVSEDVQEGAPIVIRLGQGVTTIETVRETQKLYNKVKEVLDDTLTRGERQLEIAGQYGLLTVLKRRTMLDDDEQSTEEISRTTVPAVDEVWRVGTKVSTEEELFEPILKQNLSTLYTLYDIDGDGQRELILAEPTTHLERITAVYSLKDEQPHQVIASGDKTIINIFEDGSIRRWNSHSNLDLSSDIRVDWSRLEKNENKILHHFIPKYEYGTQTTLLDGEREEQRVSYDDYNAFEQSIRQKTSEKLDFIWYAVDTRSEVARELSDFMTPREAYLLFETAITTDYLYPHRLLTSDSTNWLYQRFGIDRSKQLIFGYSNAGGAGGGSFRFVKRDDGLIDYVSYGGGLSFMLRDADSQKILTKSGRIVDELTEWTLTPRELKRAKDKLSKALKTSSGADLFDHYDYQPLTEQQDYKFVIFTSPQTYHSFGVDLIDDRAYYLEDFRKDRLGRRYVFTLEQLDKQLKIFTQVYNQSDSDSDGILNYSDSRPKVWNVSDRDLAIFASLAYADYLDLHSIFSKKDSRGNPIHFLSQDIRKKINSLGQINDLDLGWSDEKLFLKWDLFEYKGVPVNSIGNNFDLLTILKNKLFNEKVTVDGLWNHHVVFVDDSKKNVVIAYRGTDEDAPELVDDIVTIHTGSNDHKRLVRKEISKILERLKLSKINFENIFITGHSLGGYLAYHGADAVNLLIKNKLRRVVNFNGPGLALVEPNEKNRLEKVDVVHYQVTDDPVNSLITLGIHPGRVERIEVHKTLNAKTGLLDFGSNYAHNMQSFFYELDSGYRSSRWRFKS